MTMTHLLDLNPLVLLQTAWSMARYGAGVQFVAHGVKGVDLVRLLHRYHVRTYAYTFPASPPGARGFRVRSEQARWAEYLLLRAGVPMTQRPHCPENRNVTQGAMPPPWADQPQQEPRRPARQRTRHPARRQRRPR